jgi:hypothetical protein
MTTSRRRNDFGHLHARHGSLPVQIADCFHRFALFHHVTSDTHSTAVAVGIELVIGRTYGNTIMYAHPLVFLETVMLICAQVQPWYAAGALSIRAVSSPYNRHAPAHSW